MRALRLTTKFGTVLLPSVVIESNGEPAALLLAFAIYVIRMPAG